jgi:preprotein translocase YajC subunit
MTSLQLMMQLIVFSTVALGIVYFLFYRPTVEAQRKTRRVISDLQVGDEVVTTSGFFGRIVDVSEPDDGPAVVSLDLGGVTVRARVTAIAELLPRPEPATTPDETHDDRRGVSAPPQPLKGGQV